MSRLLTIALLSSRADVPDRKHDKRYTIIRFPESYKAAVEGSIKALSSYIPANIHPEHFEMLCPVTDPEGAIIWSTFNPADWSIVTEEMVGKVLGIRQKFEKGEGGPGADEDSNKENTLFPIGQVGLAYGVFKTGTTSWSHVSILPGSITPLPSINRPRSYQEAVNFIKLFIANSNTDYFNGLKNGVDLNNLDFKFHAFTSEKGGRPTTDLWIDFPERAYTNNAIWRVFVPKPFCILGFTLHERQTQHIKE